MKRLCDPPYFSANNTTLPRAPDLNKSPRLQVLDTGMLNYFTGIQKEIIGTEDLDNVYHGTMVEHMVGQELSARQTSALHGLSFWVTEKSGTNAEVDFITQYDSRLIAVEVKAGSTGILKSFFAFIDLCPHQTGVRFSAGKVAVNDLTSPKGKSFDF